MDARNHSSRGRPCARGVGEESGDLQERAGPRLGDGLLAVSGDAMLSTDSWQSDLGISFLKGLADARTFVRGATRNAAHGGFAHESHHETVNQ